MLQHEKRNIRHYPRHFHPHENRTGWMVVEDPEIELLARELAAEYNNYIGYHNQGYYNNAGYFKLSEVVKAVTPIGGLVNIMKLAKYLIAHPSEVQPTIAAIGAVIAAATGAVTPQVMTSVQQLQKVSKAAGLSTIMDAFIQKHAPQALAASAAPASSKPSTPTQRSSTNSAPTPKPADHKVLWWSLGIGGALILLTVIIILIVRMRRKKKKTD